MAYKLRAIVFFTIAVVLAGQHSIAKSQLRSENSYKNSDKMAKKNKYKNRRLLVRYKEGVSANKKDGIHFSVGAYVVQSFDVPKNLDVVEVAKGISLDAAQEFYLEDPNVLYVEPDYPLHAFLEPPPSDPTPPDDDDPKTPSIDPRYPEQWGLNNTGQAGGTIDADINAPEMWQHLTGNKNIIIAVVDTGVNYLHPELKKNMWINPGEIPGNNIDDDNNGVVDDVFGYNAIDNTGDPMDDNGHGSHCAGIIGAEAHNTEGGRGVMPEVSIIGCKFLSYDGSGSTVGAISCLDYLRKLKTRAENSVAIFATNNSWGGGPASQALQDAIQAHQNEGILFFAAAGNDGDDNDIVDSYPADYPLANIVSVGSTDNKDELSSFSNYGKRTVHVGAPGEGILSTVLDGDYEEMSGTSMATPFATGLAGMIKAHDPSLNYIQVKNLLMAGGTPLPSLDGKTVSGRRIRALDQNGLGSLTCENQIVSGRLSPSMDYIVVSIGQKVLLSAININCSEPNGDIIIPFMPGKGALPLIDDGEGIDSAAHDGMYTTEWLAERPGKFEFIFPQNDKVTINVYDPEQLGAYIHEDEPEFNYRNIVGTALGAKDDWATTIPTPFAINFAGTDQGFGFDMITIGSNGILSFTNNNLIDITNQQFPTNDYVSLIAPFWDDLNPSPNGDIYYDTLGQTPNREFVVEWRDVNPFNYTDTATDPGTFQVIFFENSSDILFNYLDVDFGDSYVNKGASATIGIQTTNTKFTQVSYDEAMLESNKSIRFKLSNPAP